MAAQRSDGGDIATGQQYISTGIDSFDNFDDAPSRSPQPHVPVDQHPLLHEDTEHVCATKARIPEPGDSSVEVRSKDLHFLTGPNGDIVTNVFLNSL